MFGMKAMFVFLFAMLICGLYAQPVYPDSESAASGDEHGGRVQIKVYRGPSEHEHDHAPWGYWVKQPADDDHH